MTNETANSAITVDRRTASTGGPAPVSIPGYEILGELGRGGMGVVYKARHSNLDRVVALKMILTAGLNSPDRLARFQREAKTIAQLRHPNIVQIFDVGEVAGQPYFTMEYLEGGNLGNMSGGLPQGLRESIDLLTTLAQAVEVAHQRQIVHRDLKPANILLTQDGTPKIADFGLAKQLDQHSLQTESGVLLGTPCYMAPEQASGSLHEIGPSADVYALGAILYQLLAGRPPFLGATTHETLRLVVNAEPVPLREFRPEIPESIEAVCLKCLQKYPEQRYATAAALAAELQKYVDEKPNSSTASFGYRRAKPSRRWAWVAALLLITNMGSLAWMGLRHPAELSEEAKQETVDKEIIANKDLAGSAQHAAARIRMERRDAKRRIQAVRELGDVECNRFPEAKDMLITSLLDDTAEEVRLEAALALGKGNCATTDVHKALTDLLSGKSRIIESSEAVKAAARKALDSIKVEIKPAPPIDLEKKKV